MLNRDIQPYKATYCMADIVSIICATHHRVFRFLPRLTLCASTRFQQDLEALENTRQEMPLWHQRRDDIFPQL